MKSEKVKTIKEFVGNTIVVASMLAISYFGITGMYPSTNVGVSLISTANPCLFTNVYKFISDNAETINRCAEENNVPAILIAATLANENECRPRYEDWLDEFGKNLGMNVSYGVAQVKIETARELYKKYFGKEIHREHALYLLSDNDWSIRFVALFYRDKIESLNINPNDIEQNPELMAHLFAMYVGGKNYTSDTALMAGYNTLLQVVDSRLSEAGIHSTSNKEKIRQFLNERKKSIKLNELKKLKKSTPS